MQEKEEQRIWYSLYGRLLDERALKAAFAKVKRAKGAPGIDGQTIADFTGVEESEIARLLQELRDKSYQPFPVRRVTIPKPNGGERELGIPAVRDRVVQQALKAILEPVFEPHFHPSSYAYRPGRSCHDAIAKVAMLTRQHDLCWAVDIDLSKCFDTLNHDLIIRCFRKRIADGSILKLLTLFLKSGVMLDGNWHANETGSPQGGVISPLVANVYLHEFDMEMMSRGHRIVRYADDILILKASKSGATNAFRQAREILESRLKLTVNEGKSNIRNLDKGIPYLGVVIRRRRVSIQDGRLAKFKAKLKAMTRRNSPVNLEKVIEDLNPVLRGFINYFKIANCQKVLRATAQWLRRRLRAKQLALWKKPKRLHRRLRQLGYKGNFKFIKMSSWRNAKSPLASYALPNGELQRLGLFWLESVQTGILPQPKLG